MPCHVHIGWDIDVEHLNRLIHLLGKCVVITTGDTAPSATRILIKGRPTADELDSLKSLEAFIIPFAGLPAETRLLLRDRKHLSVYNTHHNASSTAEMAIALTYMGRPEQAISQLKKAMRMNPRHPSWYWQVLGFAYYEVGQYKEALSILKQDNKPWFKTHRTLAAVYVRLGLLEEARAEVSKLFEKNSHYTLKSENYQPYKDETRRQRLINDLLKAGVPK